MCEYQNKIESFGMTTMCGDHINALHLCDPRPVSVETDRPIVTFKVFEYYGKHHTAVQSFFHNPKENRDDVSEETALTITLRDTDPSSTGRPTHLCNSMNTDTRMCQEVRRELGILTKLFVLLHLMDMFFSWRGYRRVMQGKHMQQGVLDSSMGWVSNRVVGSPAFAAYDQGSSLDFPIFQSLISLHTNCTGYDVFLGILLMEPTRTETEQTNG